MAARWERDELYIVEHREPHEDILGLTTLWAVIALWERGLLAVSREVHRGADAFVPDWPEGL